MKDCGAKRIEKKLKVINIHEDVGRGMQKQ
jgi:hypothetical protein